MLRKGFETDQPASGGRVFDHYYSTIDGKAPLRSVWGKERRKVPEDKAVQAVRQTQEQKCGQMSFAVKKT